METAASRDSSANERQSARRTRKETCNMRDDPFVTPDVSGVGRLPGPPRGRKRGRAPPRKFRQPTSRARRSIPVGAQEQEQEAMAEVPTKPGGKAATARTQNKAADFAWLYNPAADPENELESEAEKPLEPRLGPEAVLCDAGELDDVAALLYRLGEPPMRVWPADLAMLEPWELPGRLFVTTVKLGLTSELPPGLDRPGVVRVAVGVRATATVTTAMLRRGFHFVVRRPVHPEALRLLFSQLLFRGRDQRRASRFSYGGEVRWRIGMRMGRCNMAEVSSEGCRLLLRETLRIGQRIALK